MGHDHAHGTSSSQKTLLGALLFTIAFAAVEAVAGWWAGSLALLSDAVHMLTDSAALGIGAIAAWLSTRPPSARHSYGLKRAEVLGALFNAVFMVGLVVAIVFAAVGRLQDPTPVKGVAVMVVAAIGLVVNLVVAWVLHRGEQTLNVRGALLHVIGDLLGSVGALAAGIVIWTTGWMPIDPLLSLVIALLILASSLRLLRDVVHVLMEGVPRHLQMEEIGASLAEIEGVGEVHDLHIWTLGSRHPALSAHLVIDRIERWPAILAVAQEMLKRRFEIHHPTLQAELRETVTVVSADQMLRDRP
ncbi:MAG: cation diffusion facilitator family transporter [Xanthomonadales bacterium]|nr:cation diffusion facilitator family transporter [Xanthomonadales bacterium]